MVLFSHFCFVPYTSAVPSTITSYTSHIIPIINNASVLYHESTFLDKNENLCERTKHSTARQAAIIAKKANVETLILGHYSTRYNGYEGFLLEASEEFDNVLLAKDGKSFDFSSSSLV